MEQNYGRPDNWVDAHPELYETKDERIKRSMAEFDRSTKAHNEAYSKQYFKGLEDFDKKWAGKMESNLPPFTNLGNHNE